MIKKILLPIKDNLIFLLCLAIIAVIYSRSLPFAFTYDDIWQIVNNKIITSNNTFFNKAIDIISNPTKPGDLYRPIPFLTYLVEWEIFGNNPVAFRLFNILLFISILLLFYVFLNKLNINKTIAKAIIIVWGVHPLSVEPVVSIVGRAELLTAFFFFIALLHAHIWLKSNYRLFWFVLSQTFLFLSLFCKENAFATTLLIWFYLWLNLKEKNKKLLFSYVSLSCVSILLAIFVRLIILKIWFFRFAVDKHIIIENPLFGMSIQERIIPSLYLLASYLKDICYPFALSPDYSMASKDMLSVIYSLNGIICFLILIIYLIALIIQHNKIYKFFGYWFFIAFILTINLLIPIGTIKADRLAFIPMAGGLTFILLVMQAYLKKTRMLLLVNGMVLFFALQTSKQIAIWENNLTLFKYAYSFNPSNPKAIYNLGAEYFKMNNYKKAKSLLLKSYNLFPNNKKLIMIMADIASKEGNLKEAIHWHKKLLNIDPNNKKALKNLQKLQSFAGFD